MGTLMMARDTEPMQKVRIIPEGPVLTLVGGLLTVTVVVVVVLVLVGVGGDKTTPFPCPFPV